MYMLQGFFSAVLLQFRIDVLLSSVG